MEYLSLHATYRSICPVLTPRGAPANGDRTPVLRCLSRAALPERAGQRVRGRGAAACAPSRVQRPPRAQGRARFPCPRRGGSPPRGRRGPPPPRPVAPPAPRPPRPPPRGPPAEPPPRPAAPRPPPP